MSSTQRSVPPHSQAVTAVVLAFGEEQLLVQCVEALLSSVDAEVRVVVVDNGCTTSAVAEVEGVAGVRVLQPAVNLGFTGGCNLGAAEATTDNLVFVNSDAVVRPTAVVRLTAALGDPGVGLATSSLRLLEQPEVMNSAGNPVHYLGLSWAGGLGEPAAQHATAVDVASVSGAAFAIRRETWEQLGGFWEEMFAYCEDAELSLRVWQQGLRVTYVPDAEVLHHYEFSRNPLKVYLLERNRMLLLLTLYQVRTLWLLGPAILGLEAAVFLVAIRQGWGRDKARGWWWMLTHVSAVRRRRRVVQRQRQRSDRALAPLLAPDFVPGVDVGVVLPRPVAWLSRAYWSLVIRAMAR